VGYESVELLMRKIGVHLQNNNGESYQIPLSAWRDLLKLAEQNGWKPKGTEPDIEYLKKRARDPEGGYDQKIMDEVIDEWNGTYMTHEHQKVTYADALNMAFALEEALKEGYVYKKHITEFVSFCKRGGFQIT
jgi:hypothetical protein